MALAKPRKLSRPTGEVIISNYIENSDNLSDLSLEQLADRFESIEQQAQLFQGRILLEARNRFDSDIKFGEWIIKIGGTLCSTTRQHRTRLMNLARFFENKELVGISMTAAYEISAPANEAIADKIYEYALNKNLSVAEIKKQIQIEKGLTADITKAEPELLPLEDFDVFKQVVLADVEELSGIDAIRVLQDCIKVIRAKEPK